ncbi:MAG: site-specific DNA-methyltransferase [Polyangiaceae bacterium]
MSVRGAAKKHDAEHLIYGDARAAKSNRLVHGDNLTVMQSILPKFAGHFRAIYMDPPFNSGRRFKEYRDVWHRESWRAMMRERIRVMYELLANDGALFAEIDDTELGTLLDILDGIFRPENRISIITIVRSAATGHKTINHGPVNVTDFLVVMAKDRASWRPNPIVRSREGRDPAYSLYLANPKDDPTTWRFESLAQFLAKDLGYESGKAASKALGKSRFERRITAFSLDNAEHIARFAQPRFEAVSQAARALIEKSRAEPNKIFILHRDARKPFILRGGDRVLLLADKVRSVGGHKKIVEPVTNVWDDIKFQGIAREGGVTFSRNKKPERLIARVLEMATSPGDAVLDPFLGSGTTAAVAHKMGRRYFGIESSDTLEDLCVPRMKRVVDGEDATGISREYGWPGGGGFAVEKR